MVAKPLRTFLVLQGIIWAVAVAIFPNARREGVRGQAMKEPSEYGLDMITLYAQGEGGSLFTFEDVEALRSHFPREKVADVTVVQEAKGRLHRGEDAAKVWFIGTDHHSPNVRTFHPAKGR